MRLICQLSLLCFLSYLAKAQLPLTAAHFKQLQQMEKTLKVPAHEMIFATEASARFKADSLFTRTLVQALKVPYSFYYSFDSLETISKLYAPDSSFKIFTWQFVKDEDYCRQRGAIQINTKDGSLKLFPLIDVSEFTKNATDSVRNNFNWIGAIYYSIIEKYDMRHQPYYTLIGYDDNDRNTTKKWIEVLRFTENGEPLFGGNFFTYPPDSIKPPPPVARFCLEYKKDAGAKMNYDKEMDVIAFEHLISETNDASKKYTLIPDGDFEGFEWKNGKWNYIASLFHFKLQDGEAPVPQPLKQADGKNNEPLLDLQSQKNQQKTQP